VVFYWAGVVLDACLALQRGVRACLRRFPRLADAWRLLPGDLLGLAVMRGCGIAVSTRTVEAGDVTAVLVEDPRVRRWFRAHLIPIRAQTLGRYVFALRPVQDDILAHECEHVRQWQRLGPFYLPLYGGSSAVQFLRGRRPYWDNAFEVAARDRAERAMPAPRDAE
jgi:hypothetical protein